MNLQWNPQRMHTSVRTASLEGISLMYRLFFYLKGKKWDSLKTVFDHTLLYSGLKWNGFKLCCFFFSISGCCNSKEKLRIPHTYQSSVSNYIYLCSALTRNDHWPFLQELKATEHKYPELMVRFLTLLLLLLLWLLFILNQCCSDLFLKMMLI